MKKLQSQQNISNPFPGLRPFELGEEHLFFGREGQTDDLLTKLNRTRFLAVVGTSGSGKSSLIRAGLLPPLYSGFLGEASSNWRVALFRPGESPILRLAAALDACSTVDPRFSGDENREIRLAQRESVLRRGSLGLIKVAEQFRMDPLENLLIVVDQFEELFRFKQEANSTEAENEADAFVKLLMNASKQREIPIFVVITMRSDFIGDCSQFRDLPEMLNSSQYLVPRLTRDQLQSAIEGPIAVGEASITTRLVNRMLNEVGTNSDQLPTLQHALMQTWNYWSDQIFSSDKPIDVGHYESIGGIENALSRHADAVFESLPDEESRQIAEVMFKGLTNVGLDNRGVRRPMKVDEICTVANASFDSVVAVIRAFSDAKCAFVSAPTVNSSSFVPSSVVDISHESLMRNWKKLASWMDEEASYAKTYRRLAETATLYKQGKADLLREPELTTQRKWKVEQQPTAAWAERYGSNFEQSIQFLDESIAHDVWKREQESKSQRRRFRWAFAIAGVCASLAVGFAVFAVKTSRLSEEAQRAEAKATALKLMTQSKIQTEENGINYTAALLAIEAVDRLELIDDSAVSEAKSTLQRSTLHLPIVATQTKSIYSYGFSKDGKYVSTVGAEGVAEIFKTETQTPMMRIKQDGAVSSVFFSDNSQYLSVLGRRQVDLIDVETQEIVYSDSFFGGEAGGVFSPNSRYLAVSSYEGSLTIIDTQKGEELFFSEYDSGYSYITFSKDSKHLLLTDSNGTARLLNLITGEEKIVNESSDSRSRYSIFSEDSHYLITYGFGEDAPIEIISTETQSVVKTLRRDGEISALHMSEENSTFLMRSADYHFETVDSKTGEILKSYYYKGDIGKVAFSKNNEIIAIFNNDLNVVEVVDMRDGRSIGLLEQETIGKLEFTPDDKYLVAQGENKIIIFDVDKKNISNTVSYDGTDNFLLSNDSKHIAIEHGENLATLINTENGQTVTSVSQPNMSSMVFSKESKYWVIGSSDRTLKIIETESGLAVSTLREANSNASSVLFSENDKYFLVNNYSNLVVFKTDKPNTNQKQFRYTNKNIGGGGISKDKNAIFIFSKGNKVEIIDSNSGDITFSTPYNKNNFRTLVITDDNKYLSVSDVENSLHLFDIENNKKLNSIEHESLISKIITSPDSRYVATKTTNNNIRITNLSTAKAGRSVEVESAGNEVYFEFSEDGKHLLSWSNAGTVQIFQSSTGKVLHTIEAEDLPESSGWQVTLSKNSENFTIHDKNGTTVILFDIQTGKKLSDFSSEKNVSSVTFSENGEYFAIKTSETLEIVGLMNIESIKQLESDTAIRYHKFSEDNSYLAMYSEDGSGEVVSLATGKTTAYINHDLDIRSLIFSKDGNYVATGSSDKTAVVTDISTGEKVSTVKSSGPISSISFSDDSNYLSVASEDRSAQLLDMRSGNITAVVEHSAGIIGNIFSPNSNHLIIYGKDRILHLINSVTGSVVKRSTYDDDISRAFFSEDGQYILTSSADNVIKLINANDGEELIAQVYDTQIDYSGFSSDSKMLITADRDKNLYLTKVSNQDVSTEDACMQLQSNLSADDWIKYIGKSLTEYSLTCSTAPVDNSLVMEASSLVRADKIEEATPIFERVKLLSPEVDLYPRSIDIEDDIQLVVEMWQADDYIQNGGRAARTNKLEKATESFQKAKEIVPHVDLNPETAENDTDPRTVVLQIAAQSKVDKNEITAYSVPDLEKTRSALSAYKEAQALYPEVPISAFQWDKLCLYGSINDIPSEALVACEAAVDKQPEHGGWRDSRGVARARTGNIGGAIEDFEYYIKWEGSAPTQKERRQEWIDALESGKNPFDSKLLKTLKK